MLGVLALVMFIAYVRFTEALHAVTSDYHWT